MRPEAVGWVLMRDHTKLRAFELADELALDDVVFFHHIKQPYNLLKYLVDRQVVPVVAFGLGGVLTEALADGRRRPASRGVPLGPQEEPGSVGPSREADHGRCYYHRGDEADCGT